jgi:hypothetical protein
MRCAMSLAAVLACCGAARAQLYSTTEATVHVSLSFAEADASGNPVANPNGVLEPGERALVQMSALITPPVDSPIHYTFNGSTGLGTLRGLGLGFYDVLGTGGVRGGYVLGPVDPTWDITGGLGWGMLSSDGQIRNVEFGQFEAGQPNNIANPILNVWRFVWAPDDYSARVATFTTAPGLSSAGVESQVVVRTGGTARHFMNCLTDYGSVNIPVVPGPGVVAMAVVGVPLAARRRRR